MRLRWALLLGCVLFVGCEEPKKVDLKDSSPEEEKAAKKADELRLREIEKKEGPQKNSWWNPAVEILV